MVLSFLAVFKESYLLLFLLYIYFRITFSGALYNLSQTQKLAVPLTGLIFTVV